MKRLVSLILTALMLSGVLCAGGLESFAVFSGSPHEINPFSAYDRLRDGILDGMAGIAAERDGMDRPYIIGFRKDTPLTEIYAAVKSLRFSLLSYSGERVLLVDLADDLLFVSAHRGIIEYAVPDESAKALTEDTAGEGSGPDWVYQAIGLASRDPSGGTGVTVAVIDGGVDRSHPELAEANILPGLNAVTGEAGVNTDETGHGTAVTGIIAGKTTGIAPGVTVLPVKITTGTETVMTSWLVSGLYFAADSGADIINMSFGGYTENKAEEAAVAYAASKGAVLVAASGNEGRDPEYSGRLSYPASYENVISVGSVGAAGEASSFSQYNRMVDTAAPGEGVTVIGFENGVPAYKTADGTSYSAAYVSAAAALAVAASKRDITSSDFAVLLDYASASPRDDYKGYGTLNIGSLLSCLNYPVVTGVSDGGSYFEDTAAFFTDASALLDGEEYISGDSIFSQGRHTLTVTDGIGSVTLSFAVDTVPLTYEIYHGGNSVNFVFGRGTATVDDMPYQSGEKVTGYGQHAFVLTGPFGNTVTEYFIISSDLPAIFGVSDGVSYDRAVVIRAVGEGHIYIDGAEAGHTVCVRTPGTHTLTYTDPSGTRSKSLSFTVSASYSVYGAPDMGYEKILCGDGFYILWSEGADTAAFVSGDITESIPLGGEAVRLNLEGSTLYAVCRNFLSVYSVNGAPSLVQSVPLPDTYTVLTAYCGNGYLCFADTEGIVYACELGEGTALPELTALDTELGGTVFCGSGDSVYAYSSYTPMTVYRFGADGWTHHELPVVPDHFGLSAAEGRIIVGGMVYDSESFNLICQLPPTEVLCTSGELAICGNGIYELTEGNPVGIFADEVFSASVCGDTLAACGAEGVFLSSRSAVFGTAEYVPVLTGQLLKTAAGRYTVPLADGCFVTSSAFNAADGTVAVITEGSKDLFFIDPATGKVKRHEYLKYIPSSLTAYAGGVLALFPDIGCVYDSASGTYSTFGRHLSSVCIAEGRLFGVRDGIFCEYVNGAVHFPLGEKSAIGIASAGNALYIFTPAAAEVYSPSIMVPFTVRETEPGGRIVCGSRYTASGSEIIDSVTLEHVSEVGGTALAVCGDAVITTDGLYAADGRLISAHRQSIYDAAFTSSFTAVLFGDISLSIIDSDGADPTKPAYADGIADGGVYANGVAISVNAGTAYLDGKKTENGERVTTAGTHRLRTITAWGVVSEITFTVSLRPTSLAFADDTVNLGVGESAALIPVILPEGATGTVVFSTDSDIISVDGTGRVTVLAQGVAYVTAYMPDFGLTAVCTVTAAGTETVCTYPGYRINRDSGIITGIASDTAVSDFLPRFTGYNCSYVISKPDGTAANGNVATGDRLLRLDSAGNVTDGLTLSVLGDIDCDGSVTVNDAFKLYTFLVNNSTPGVHIFNAADINGNGRLTSVDLGLLRGMLGGYSAESAGNPYINIPLFAYAGDSFYVTLESTGLGSPDAVCGSVTYDAKRLTLDRVMSFESEAYITKNAGNVGYCLLGTGKSGSGGRLLRLFFTVNKDVTGNAEIAFTGTRISQGTVKSVENAVRVLEIRGLPAAELTVTATNADLVFDPSVTEYELEIPENDSLLGLVFECPAGGHVYFDSLPVYKGTERTLNLTYIAPDGTLHTYVFRVKRAASTQSGVTLASLTANGTLTPAFDPAIRSYECVIARGETPHVKVSVPEDTEVSVEYRGDVAYITLTAADGRASVYTVVFIRNGEVSDPSGEVSEPASGNSGEPSEASSEVSGRRVRLSAGDITGIVLAALGIIAVTAVLVFRRRSKEE